MSSESPISILRNARVIAWASFVVLCSSATAYYIAFYCMAPYDDEGTMMWGLKRFLEGSVLYDEVASIYGPLYYLYEWCAHALTGTELSHHSVRMVSVGFWVAAALIIFLLAYRSTGSLLLASLTHFLTFCTMGFIGREAAHPQEACMLLLTSLGLACFAQKRSGRAAIMGALAGAAVMTKINFGILIVIALSASFVFGMRPHRLRTIASAFVWTGLLVFPVLLMWGHLSEWWAMKFCAVVVLSVWSAALIVSGNDWFAPVGFRDLLIGGLALVTSIAAICSFPLAHGSTVPAMLDWLIIKPRIYIGQTWYSPMTIHSLALPWAAGSLLLAYYARSGRVRPAILACCKVAFAVVAIVLCVISDYSALIGFGPPFMWLVAAHRRDVDTASEDGQARALLLLLGVLQVLYAYPVAGAQTRFAIVLIIPMAALCLSDGFTWVRIHASRNGVPLLLSRNKWARLAAFICVSAAYLALAWKAETTYTNLTPLGLPGTAAMRAEPEKVAALRALVAVVASSGCRTLITEPGLFSFNLFTGTPVPAGLGGGGWMAGNPGVQESIVQDVAKDPNACVILRPDMVDMWTRHVDVSSKPLVRYIRDRFRSTLEIGGYRFLVRKD